MGSPVALDLSMKEKTTFKEQNNNDIKEEMVMPGPSGVESTGIKRKFSECSSASQSSDDSNPSSLHENLDVSFDSTSTCPSEASTNNVSGLVMARKKTKPVEGADPKKIPYVSLEYD